MQLVGHVHAHQGAVHDDRGHEHWAEVKGHSAGNTSKVHQRRLTGGSHDQQDTADDAAQRPDGDGQAGQEDGLAVDVGLHAQRQQRLDQDVESPHAQGERRPHQVDGEQRGFLPKRRIGVFTSAWSEQDFLFLAWTSCSHLEVGHHTHPQRADEAQRQPGPVQTPERTASIGSQRLHLFVADVDGGHAWGGGDTGEQL